MVYYKDKPINSDELESLKLSVNNYIYKICHNIYKRHKSGFFNNMIIKVTDWFRKDMYKFALEYLDVVRS